MIYTLLNVGEGTSPMDLAGRAKQGSWGPQWWLGGPLEPACSPTTLGGRGWRL
jgi:hypothetical protein